MMQPMEQPTRQGRSGWRRRSEQLDSIQDLLVRIDAALVVRDPGTARSVDAYDGLRKQVIAAAGERRRMLVFLSELAEALRLGQSTDVLRSKTDEWMLQANLIQIADPTSEEAFEIVGTADGAVVVAVPAYVDGATGIIVRRGVAERVPTPDRGKPDPLSDLVTADGVVSDSSDVTEPESNGRD